MQAKVLEGHMKSLGLTFIFGLFLQIRIDDRSILLPFFAGWSLYVLSQLQDYRAFSDNSWFTTSWVCAAVVSVAGVIGWIPAVDPGFAAAVITLGVALGAAGYVGSLHLWCVRQGWSQPAAVARTARVWCLATFGVMAASYLAQALFVEPGPADPDSNMSPSTMFGRPIGGAGATVAFFGILVVWIVASIKLRKASQLVRHSLHANPDAELVSA